MSPIDLIDANKAASFELGHKALSTLLPSMIPDTERFKDLSLTSPEEEIYEPSLPGGAYEFYIFPTQVSIKGLTLKRPLKVVVEKSKDVFCFYSEALNISSIGYTKEEAFKNFIKFLIEDYQSYESTPGNQLSQGAKELLSRYKSFIRRR